MPIVISRRARNSAPLRSAQVKSIAKKMLQLLDLEQSELSILLCDDNLIQEINLEHRGKDKPTDVLSFPQIEFGEPEVILPTFNLSLLGDVVISIDTAERQAVSRHRPLIEEVRFLLAHGLLHLLGHDHAEPLEKKRMKKRTADLVRAAALP